MANFNFPKTPKIGAGIFAIDIQTGDILLGRRGGNTSTSNLWAPFGGTFELKDGSPKETAKREFKEESGCDVNFKVSSGPFFVNRDSYLTFYTYIGLFDGKFPVNISNESLGYMWTDLDHMPNNLLPGFKDLYEQKYNELKKLIEKLVSESREKREKEEIEEGI